MHRASLRPPPVFFKFQISTFGLPLFIRLLAWADKDLEPLREKIGEI